MTDGNIDFGGLGRFNMKLRYIDGIVEPEEAIGQHTHSECEIYIHLDGDVSFMVENRIYPVQYGDVIITKPYEYHHCIYHRTTKHRHFWILFSGVDNEHLLDLFFERKKGTGNLLHLSAEETLRLTKICERLCRDTLSEIEKYCCFFEMLRALEGAESLTKERIVNKNDIAAVLETIHRNYAEKLTVKMLAKEAHISVSTLERWFFDNLGTTPFGYIKKVRLENAARMLSEQFSVTESAELSGFSDVSAMITLFKKQYGVTPHKYKKSHVR